MNRKKKENQQEPNNFKPCEANSNKPNKTRQKEIKGKKRQAARQTF